VSMSRRVGLVVIAVAALAAGVLAHLGARHTSATFDEIILVSGGVRGMQEGRWEMVTDQPPLMMYAYGIAAGGAVVERPAEDRSWLFDDRWTYAREFFFGGENDARAVLGRARALAAVIAALTVAVAALYAWWIAGPLAGALAALLTALLPDVIAHGGVAYNDLPLALAFLLSVWALDAAVRRPSPQSAALAAVAVAAALGTKLSALALGPVAVLLLAAEVVARRADRGWWRDLAVSTGIGLVAMYVAMVLLYRGDPTLTLFRFNFWRTVLHASGGYEVPAYLLGAMSATGWWYYFPAAFLFKTPVAFQGILGLAGASLGWRWVSEGRPLARLLGWRGRGAALGALVFGAFLMRSELNAGFRYALPALPLLAVVGALGAAHVWRTWDRFGRIVVPLLIALQAASVLSVYPHFLAYSSLWAGGRDEAHRVLVDSNLDWGQELLELRRFMEREGVPSVRLSYFGSAPPDAYGIEYVALPSFFRLDYLRTGNAETAPRFTVISATNLHGVYLQGRDPFAAYRERQPYAILGHSLFVYDERGGG